MIIAIINIICGAYLNLSQDYTLAETAEAINNQYVEKFVSQRSRKAFKMSTWGNIKMGDVIKIKHD